MQSVKLSRSAHSQSWNFALAVCAVGIAGLARDSWPDLMQEPRINLHAVFGLLLWTKVVVQFRQRAGYLSLMHEADFDSLCRQLSREVYILLYIVFGANQIIGAGASFWNRSIWSVSHPAIQQPPENLRDFLAYGIVALLTIRALAALHRHALKRVSQTSTLADLQHHK
jgi:cytochrome b561